MKLKERYRVFRSETYVCFIPVISPRAAGAAMMVSPKLFFTEEFSKLFGRNKSAVEPTAAPTSSVAPESHDAYRADEWDGVERIQFYVGDDLEVVIYNTNPAVRLGDLSAVDQARLLMDGFYQHHIRDDNFLRYSPLP